MTGESRKGERTLAQIESDLLEAEAALNDADKRLADAERDRRAAIDTINRHQTEFDEAVAGLRKRSASGSRWWLELDKPDGALILQAGDIAKDADQPGPPRPASVSDEFDRLRNLVQSVGNDHAPASSARGEVA